jgi:TolA-binding protein
VTAENGTFLARAARITYNQAKEWLILEGNGYAPAELSFQEYVGAAPTTQAASKIFFWPETKRVEIDGGRPMQIDGLLR